MRRALGIAATTVALLGATLTVAGPAGAATDTCLPAVGVPVNACLYTRTYGGGRAWVVGVGVGGTAQNTYRDGTFVEVLCNYTNGTLYPRFGTGSNETTIDTDLLGLPGVVGCEGIPIP